jgi:hypothetical protein
VNKSRNVNNDIGQTVTMTVAKQYCKHYLLSMIAIKYITDLTTNRIVITDAIKFVQTNKKKLIMSSNEDKNGEESKEPDYDEDKKPLGYRLPEYPQIAEHIKQTLDDAYHGLKEPKEALNEAAAKSAKVLGW